MLGCASREAANMRAMPWSGTQTSVWQETVQIGRRRREREGETRRERDMKRTTKLRLALVFLTDKYWAICRRKRFYFFGNPLQLTKCSLGIRSLKFILTVYSIFFRSYFTLTATHTYTLHNISVALSCGIPFFYFVKKLQATKQTPMKRRATQSLIKCSSMSWKWLRSPNLREAINPKSSGVRELYSVTPQHLTRWIMQRWRWKSRILRAKVIIYFRS